MNARDAWLLKKNEKEKRIFYFYETLKGKKHND